MQYIGCHLTISKGFFAMGKQALELGGTTAQFFTRNPRGGSAKDLDPEDVAWMISASQCSLINRWKISMTSLMVTNVSRQLI